MIDPPRKYFANLIGHLCLGWGGEYIIELFERPLYFGNPVVKHRESGEIQTCIGWIRDQDFARENVRIDTNAPDSVIFPSMRGNAIDRNAAQGMPTSVDADITMNSGHRASLSGPCRRRKPGPSRSDR